MFKYFKNKIAEKKELEREIKEYIDDDEEEKINLWQIFKQDSLDDEENYLNEDELTELLKERKSDKVFFIKVGAIISSVFVVVLIGLFIFNYYVTDDIIKVTKPLIEEYYQTKYDKVVKITELDYICDEECSKIAVAKTKDDKYIISLDNNLFGDNYTNAVIEEYTTYLNNNFSELAIVNHHPKLSYQDFYLNYNYYSPYIDILPNDYDFSKLIATKKLTIIDMIFYQGNIDFSKINNLMNNLSDDSQLILIKQEKGLPSLLTIITKTKNVSLNITTSIILEKGITYYELDRHNNMVGSLNLSSVSASSFALENMIVNKAFKVNLEINKNNQNEEKSNYYFLRIDKEIMNFENKNNYFFFDRAYREIKDYTTLDTYIIHSGEYAYIVGSHEVGIATTTTKEAFWCRLNLC